MEAASSSSESWLRAGEAPLRVGGGDDSGEDVLRRLRDIVLHVREVKLNVRRKLERVAGPTWPKRRHSGNIIVAG